MNDTMKAVRLKSPGDPDRMYIGDAPKPVPGPRELLVRVHATALNRADLMQRRGKYDPPPGASDIMGLEMAGVVEAVGDDVRDFKPGDRVMSLLPGGGYAQFVSVNEGMAMRIPPNLDFAQAAAIPEVFLTTFQALCWLGNLEEGETVLIHAGASGVGTAAIQIASHKASTVIATAGSEKKLDACKQLGARVAVNYKQSGFAEAVLAATDGTGAHVIIDVVGAPYWEPNTACLAIDGRIVVLAFMGGPLIDQFDLRKLFRKRGSLITSTLRSRTETYKIALTKDFSDRWLKRFENGDLRPVIDSVYPWTDVAGAHKRMESNLNIGKIVLQIS